MKAIITNVYPKSYTLIIPLSPYNVREIQKAIQVSIEHDVPVVAQVFGCFKRKRIDPVFELIDVEDDLVAAEAVRLIIHYENTLEIQVLRSERMYINIIELEIDEETFLS